MFYLVVRSLLISVSLSQLLAVGNTCFPGVFSHGGKTACVSRGLRGASLAHARVLWHSDRGEPSEFSLLPQVREHLGQEAGQTVKTVLFYSGVLRNDTWTPARPLTGEITGRTSKKPTPSLARSSIRGPSLCPKQPVLFRGKVKQRNQHTTENHSS